MHLSFQRQGDGHIAAAQGILPAGQVVAVPGHGRHLIANRLARREQQARTSAGELRLPLWEMAPANVEKLRASLLEVGVNLVK